jgi:hypothetical protein
MMPPAPGRRAVGEQGAVARAQQGAQQLPFLGEQFWRHHGVHAPMDAVDPAGAERADNPRAAHPGSQQLRPADDARLLARDRPNCVGLGSVSGLNSTQFGHAAMIGAHAAPALHAFVTSLRRRSPP